MGRTEVTSEAYSNVTSRATRQIQLWKAPLGPPAHLNVSHRFAVSNSSKL